MPSIDYESVYNLVDKKVGEVNLSIKDLTRTVEGLQRDVSTIQAQNKLATALMSGAIGGFFTIVNIVITFIKPR